MNIADYSKMLAVTKHYNNRENLVYNYLQEIINISTVMKYNSVLEDVKKILEQYGEIKTAKIDDKKIPYIIISPSLELREHIINLKHQVRDQQERDFSEKILSL